jgi:hypothetical protein
VGIGPAYRLASPTKKPCWLSAGARTAGSWRRLPGNVSAAQLAIAEELRQAGFELHDDNEELIARLPTIFAVLDDGRSVQRLGSGEWVVLRDYG